MPILHQVLVAFVCLAVCVRLVSYLHRRFVERTIREPLSMLLDWLIAQVADIDNTPLADLNVRDDVRLDGYIELVYWVYPRGGSFGLRRACRWSDEQYEFSLSARFSPLSRKSFSCRSAWFTERMDKLTGLLDIYPRERMLKHRARQSRTENADSADHTSNRPAS